MWGRFFKSVLNTGRLTRSVVNAANIAAQTALVVTIGNYQDKSSKEAVENNNSLPPLENNNGVSSENFSPR